MLIRTGTSSTKIGEQIRSFIKKELRVTYFVESLGPWEYEMGIELEQARELTDFSESLMDALSPTRIEIQVLNELEDLKWSFYPGSE